MIGVAAIKHLIEVGQVAHHRNHMVLNITQVKPDLGARRNTVLIIATFGKPFNNVGFSSQKTHKRINFFATLANLAEKGRKVVVAGDKDLFFDGIGFTLDVGDNGTKGIDNIISVDRSVSDCIPG